MLNAEQARRNLDLQSPTAALVHKEGIQPQRARQQTRVQLSQRMRDGVERGGVERDGVEREMELRRRHARGPI
jgi:hypothetical protein